ncbi:META domain-containing protein [Maribellus mangrovi]|uniref:META domain-containing protein n=1 Tax=Maribellus mangrovi TaxID=3133146 RepID=UPI0030EB6964
MKFIYLLTLIFIIVSCNTTNENIYWVNSYQVDCVGVGPMKCMLIQKGKAIEDGTWQNFYSKIEGFEYEPGFIYKLKVKEEQLENVPADASSIKYILVDVLEKTEDSKLGLNGTWNAQKINGSIIKLPSTRGAGVLPTVYIDITKMQISGIDNCNNFTGSISKLSESTIELGPLAATQKMCPDMAIATAFNKALQAVKQYELSENTLTFKDENGNDLLEFTKGTEAKILLNDIWVAEVVEGEAINDEGKAPRLEINSTELTVSGTDGCNNISGKISTLTNSELVFGMLVGTKKMCMDMNIPDKFNKLIPQVRGYKITNMKLSLSDEQGEVLIIMKKVD